MSSNDGSRRTLEREANGARARLLGAVQGLEQKGRELEGAERELELRARQGAAVAVIVGAAATAVGLLAAYDRLTRGHSLFRRRATAGHRLVQGALLFAVAAAARVPMLRLLRPRPRAQMPRSDSASATT